MCERDSTVRGSMDKKVNQTVEYIFVDEGGGGGRISAKG